jgi:DNA-binding TFAR19-related protein (PDSD5 family)
VTQDLTDELDEQALVRLFRLRGVAVPPEVAADLVEPVRALLEQTGNVRAALREMELRA